MPAAAITPRELEFIEAMTECAFELGKAAFERAKQAPDTRSFVDLANAFHRLGSAVRLGIRLKYAQPRDLARPAERETPENDAPERAETIEVERAEPRERVDDRPDRERDYEPVSLPLFLKTLGIAARRIEPYADELPAHVRTETLPRLRGLLAEAEVKAAPASRPAAAAVLKRPPAPPRARSSLLASTSAPLNLLRPRDSS